MAKKKSVRRKAIEDDFIGELHEPIRRSILAARSGTKERLRWPKYPFCGEQDFENVLHLFRFDGSDAHDLSVGQIETLRLLFPDHPCDKPNWNWIKAQLIDRCRHTAETVKRLSAGSILDFLRTLPEAKLALSNVPTSFVITHHSCTEKAESLEQIFNSIRRLAGALHNFQRTVCGDWFLEDIGKHFASISTEAARLGWMNSGDHRRQALAPIYLANVLAEFDGRNWQSYHDAAFGIGNRFLLEIRKIGQFGGDPEWCGDMSDEKFNQQGKSVARLASTLKDNWQLRTVDFVSLIALLDREYVRATYSAETYTNRLSLPANPNQTTQGRANPPAPNAWHHSGDEPPSDFKSEIKGKLKELGKALGVSSRKVVDKLGPTRWGRKNDYRSYSIFYKSESEFKLVSARLETSRSALKERETT